MEITLFYFEEPGFGAAFGYQRFDGVGRFNGPVGLNEAGAFFDDGLIRFCPLRGVRQFVVSGGGGDHAHHAAFVQVIVERF